MDNTKMMEMEINNLFPENLKCSVGRWRRTGWAAGSEGRPVGPATLSTRTLPGTMTNRWSTQGGMNMLFIVPFIGDLDACRLHYANQRQGSSGDVQMELDRREPWALDPV
ncbi:uncharacterized protein [Lolium perenne]|uniref:uncharacterized protein isoform X2 n=1 Tax=Lolium perenne TaxID=4522 RepID=UPI003A9A57A7